MLQKLKLPFFRTGILLLGTGFMYQQVTPFFLSVGSILLGLSSLLPPYHFRANRYAWIILLIWVMNLLSGLWSENIHDWLQVIVRQLALILIPLAALNPPDKTGNSFFKKAHLYWISLAAVFAIISLFRYLLYKNNIDLALLESGAIPIWDGKSWPWHLTAISSSKFQESGINHIYFSLIQAVALFYCGFAWSKSKKAIWLVLGIIHLITIHWFLARTGIIGLYFGLLILMLWHWRRSKSNKYVWIGLGFCLIIPLVSYFSFEAVRNKVKNSMEDLQAIHGDRSINHRSLAMRVEAWKTAWHILKKHPMGVGLGDADQAMAQQYNEDESMLWLENRIPPHNQYLEIAIASGWPNALLLLSLLIGGILDYWRKPRLLKLAIYSCFLVALCFESILQTQLGICLFPFFLLFVNEMGEPKAPEQ
ncbi:MAG: hypothetical protein GC180_02340 [Bacteroidetes bacterium]|nr:hypothetical protein [Bacteroidota bacterium]